MTSFLETPERFQCNDYHNEFASVIMIWFMKGKKLKIELNEQFQKALKLLENTSKNIFITGKAGTGKSTLLTYFRDTTKKKIVVLAPTGVAAINVRGQTIHSFFKFKPSITLDLVKNEKIKDGKNIYKKLDAIIIDEISMVRSDLLDCVDKFLRLNGKDKSLPFGGVQMIFIGDLYQLPPVVKGDEREIFKTHYKSQYFFDATVFENFPIELIELEKIYRQKDQKFIDLLNAVRNNSAKEIHFDILNKRYNPDFEPVNNDFYIYLTTTNRLAEEINQYQLSKIDDKLYSYHGSVTGDFDTYALPTQIELLIKVGAQVMMLNNDPSGRWVNGTIGKIVGIEKDEEKDVLVVELAEGEIVYVEKYTWELFHFSYNQVKRSLTSETVGTFTQFPLTLAWAVTIHKSQGKTFDKVIIDIGNGTFAHGQMYVALSRCTTLSGLVLKKPIQKKHIFMDWRVVKFLTKYQYEISEAALSLNQKIEMLNKAIERNKKLDVIYLKANDEKSKRRIEPYTVEEMTYAGKKFLGVSCYDSLRQQDRVFRVDRILEMKEV
jgi:ATP-dependent DNA helicase PIF1